MNEQGSKKILFNKSTLLSLKAELLKKQEEVNGKKHLPKHNPENFKPTSKSSKKCDLKKTDKLSFKDRLKANDVEELEACRKSKLALEKKTALYEHLADSNGSSQFAANFLVDFDTKKQEKDISKSLVIQSSEPEQVLHDELLQSAEDDKEWTEFTDCLGRTRKCLKADLDLYLRRDKALVKATIKNHEGDPSNDTEQPNITKKPFLVEKTNDYLQSLREKWEQQEKELEIRTAKNKDIHYQDLLFDEARIHGTAYYSFSTDEAERQKQMQELIKTREETLRLQAEAEEKRKKRDELMAARVAAARARQRMRAGLPPEDPDKDKKTFTECLLELLNKQKEEADEKAKENEKKLKEEQEKERQKLRDAYVREWDLGKEGVDDKVKKFREMTQEEYVEQQRANRIEEFAPPQVLSAERNTYSFDNSGRFMPINGTSSTQNKSWADVLPKPIETFPPPIRENYEESNKGLYFTSKKFVQYKNFSKVQEQEPVPIEDELNDEGIVYQKNDERNLETDHIGIAPPPTYDYYGPIPKKIKPNKPFHSDMQEAYAQGAKSLETKQSNRNLPKHYDFTFD